MKKKRPLRKLAAISGIVVTILMLLAFGSKLVDSIIQNGFAAEMKEIGAALFHWYDDPTGFFFLYLSGYVIAMWKPIWGAIIIIMASLLVAIINYDNMGFIVTGLLTFLVGFFYLMAYHFKKEA